MIDFALKYEAVIFASLEEITPSSNILKYFIEEFKDKDLIPSTIQQVTPTEIIDRLIFRSKNHDWSIIFGVNKLNIAKINNNIFVSDFGSKEKFIEEVIEIIKIIFKRFKHKANRISFLTHYICKAIDKRKLDDIASKISVLPNTLKKSPLVNWNHRYVSRIEKKIGKRRELINFISEINRVQGNLKINSKIEKFDRIELKFDINTFQGNKEYRFSIGEIEKYYSNVYKWEDDLLNEFLILIEE